MTTLLSGVKDFQAGMSCFDVLMRKGKLSDTIPLLTHYSAFASITVQKSGHFHVPIYQRLREDQFHAPIDQLCSEVHGNFHVPFDQLYREVHGNFHVPFDQLCREVYGNFHVPFEQLCLGVHENFHVPFEQLSFGEEHGNFHVSCDQLQLSGGTREFPCSFCKNFLNKLFF